MSNRERGSFEGAIHHIWQRGNNRDCIFQNSRTKAFFIRQLKEYNKKFDYNVLAFVIMDNHYHLLMQTFNDPIGEVMFNINNVTGKFIKDYLKRTGHVFQGRYNSKLVKTDEYLLWLIRYIHRNPVRAKICEKVEDYKWSSHHFYSSGYSNFVNVDLPLSIFSSDKKKAIMLYWELMNCSGNDDSSEKDYEFLSNKLSQFKGKKFFTNIKPELTKRITFQEIIDSMNLQPEEICLLKTGSRKRYLTDIKLSFVNKALNEKYTISEIASFLNTTQPAISKLLINHNK